MSQAGLASDQTSPSADVEFLTGNDGIRVGPDATFNINVLGSGINTVTGNAATNTITVVGPTVTNHSPLIGGAGNTITSLGPLTNGQLIIGNTGNDPTAATLTAGTGIMITNAAGSITIDSSGGVNWQTVGASQALVANNGYICTSGAALSFSLPAVSALGSTISITLDGSTSWTITQAAGQQIRFGSSQTTLGAGGSLASTAQGDTITMVCSVANTRWNVISSIGNITVV